MECKYCGTPNPDDATFCKKCGKRVDGMDVCPACGKLTPADGDFCVNCGADKNAPPASAAAKVIPVGEYGAPMGEAAAVAVAEAEGAAVAEEAVQEEGYMFEKYRGLLKKVSLMFSCLAALMGIIFVFLIECSLSTNYSGASASGYDIFYFFGNVYDDIESIASYYSSAYVEKAYTAGAAFGTVCCAAGMAMTIICFLVAVVRLFKKNGGGTEKKLFAPCAATFISFACTSALFMMCVSFNVNYSSESYGYKLGGTAITGIVLGAIFLAIAVASNVMANLKRESLRPYAVNGVFGVLMAVCGLVALGVMANGIFACKEDAEKVSIGIFYLFAGIMTSDAPSSNAESSVIAAYNKMYLTELALTIVFVVAAIGFCIFLIAALSDILSCKGEDISPKAIKHVTAAGVYAVICGVVMIVCMCVYLNYIDYDLEASLAAPIVMIVFGVLLAAVAVAYKKRHKISALKPYLA